MLELATLELEPVTLALEPVTLELEVAPPARVAPSGLASWSYRAPQAPTRPAASRRSGNADRRMILLQGLKGQTTMGEIRRWCPPWLRSPGLHVLQMEDRLPWNAQPHVPGLLLREGRGPVIERFHTSGDLVILALGITELDDQR